MQMHIIIHIQCYVYGIMLCINFHEQRYDNSPKRIPYNGHAHKFQIHIIHSKNPSTVNYLTVVLHLALLLPNCRSSLLVLLSPFAQICNLSLQNFFQHQNANIMTVRYLMVIQQITASTQQQLQGIGARQTVIFVTLKNVLCCKNNLL
jgi:hypothetical protein